MISKRLGHSRGYADHGWLKSAHSFSFASYYDPQHMGIGNLRVINEDRIASGSGFGTHPHQNMEIISYVLTGALAHRDSMGNGTTIYPGDVQRMSAGSGVTHSEFNAHAGETHFLQIWLLPNQANIPPSYEQKHFGAETKSGQLRLLVSSDGRDGSVSMHANADLYAGLFDGDQSAELSLDRDQIGYVHLVRGALKVNGIALNAGDALTLTEESRVHLTSGQAAEALVFALSTR
jgi:quercetin 2,3-dioxygenase